MDGLSLPRGGAPAETDSQPIRGLLWLTGAALAVRAAFLLLEPATGPLADERTWVNTAVEILLSERVSLSPLRTNMIFYPPIYPYFIAFIYLAFESLTAVKWFQIFVSSLLVPAVGLAGARAFGPRAGLVAGGVVAFYPELVWFSVHFWSETLFMLFLWWGLERLLAADAAQRRRLAALAGLLWGLAILTRETALYFTPLVAVWLGLNRRGREGWRLAASFLVVVLLTVTPWTYRNWVRYRAFVPVSTSGGLALFQGNAPLTRDEVYAVRDSVSGRVNQYRFLRSKGIEVILERQPWWLFEKLRDEMPKFWEADSLALIHIKRDGYGRGVRPGVVLAAAAVIVLPYLALLAAFVAGLAALRLDRRRFLLLLFLVFYNSIHIVTHGFARYRLPALPVVIVVAAAAWAAWREGSYPRLGRSRKLLAASLALALAVTLVPSFRINAREPAFGLPWLRTPPASPGQPAP